jgi:hypothetical protein
MTKPLIKTPYSLDEMTEEFERQQHQLRSGFYGWMGLGGAIIQWHPHLKIGIAYVPTDLLILDFYNFKAAHLQAAVKQVVMACDSRAKL